jgi:hypothetical protein
MHFLSDLDGPTVLLTGLSFALASLVLALLWVSYGGRWAGGGGILGLLLLPVFFSVPLAYEAYCPDADQPHIRRTGSVNAFKPYRYPTGRHSHAYGILECVGPCGKGVPLMEFNEQATALVNGKDSSLPLTVTYLGRIEQADLDNNYQITAHPVVEIDDTASGERIFYVDTTRHWPRVIFLLADVLICVATAAYCLTHVESNPSKSDSSSDQS